jgi:translation initiation factor 3 subunit J
MTDNWDDGSDDEWDVDDDALDAKLGIKKDDDNAAPAFDDEEDMALVEKAAADKANQADLKKKGSALAAKKQAEKERLEEEEIARKQMEYEEEMLAHMTPDERKVHERQREEAADLAMASDFLGAADDTRGPGSDGAVAGIGVATLAGDKVVLIDMKDHMKHARKVAEAMKVRSLRRHVVLVRSPVL